MNPDQPELSSGWTFDETSGMVYHFEHVPAKEARARASERDRVYVIETVNWTTDASGKIAHLNRYFALSFPSAVAFAARSEIEWQEVAEDVVAIRPATGDEEATFWKVSDHFMSQMSQMPPALSDTQADSLPEVDGG